MSIIDELDAWIHTEMAEAMQWIESGLDVRFDPDFRALVEEAREREEFGELVSYFEHRQAIVDNLDYWLRFAAPVRFYRTITIGVKTRRA